MAGGVHDDRRTWCSVARRIVQNTGKMAETVFLHNAFPSMTTSYATHLAIKAALGHKEKYLTLSPGSILDRY